MNLGTYGNGFSVLSFIKLLDNDTYMMEAFLLAFNKGEICLWPIPIQKPFMIWCCFINRRNFSINFWNMLHKRVKTKFLSRPYNWSKKNQLSNIIRHGVRNTDNLIERIKKTIILLNNWLRGEALHVFLPRFSPSRRSSPFTYTL